MYTKLKDTGFTIIEITIATLIFSSILITITVGVTAFSHGYYKGINATNVQTTNRQALEQIAQSIQLSGANVSSPVVDRSNNFEYFCAGSTIYVYNQSGALYDGARATATNLGLLAVPLQSGCTAPTSAQIAQGHELLDRHMRVLNVTMSTAATNTWTITLSIAYGSSDRLCETGIPANTQGGCAVGDPQNNPTDPVSGTDVQCRPGSGGDFCYVSKLGTTVQQRIGQ